ncbi:MAG: 50S ribosome-binding GTPase [Candidatus Aramenus sp.]|jgi:ribosome biogenesis GTPase A|nr:50S ribosome-binding GTPase [Candidatus Aramenus sp.]
MLRKVFSIISKSNVVVEVLDAREPELTRSKTIEGFSKEKGKKLLLAINKGDLVPRDVSEKWKEYFASQGLRVVYLSATGHMGTMVLRREIKQLLLGKEGIVCFVGYPKTGKSSIINALKGRHSASTSAHPMEIGYTKAPQLFKIDSKIYAWDTPGVIPPEGDPVERIIRGYSVDEMEDPVKAAVLLIKRIEGFDRKSLEEVYGEYRNPYDLLAKIALKRGWIYKKDKEPNIEEAAKAVIRDYHEGKIIYFSLPPQRSR